MPQNRLSPTSPGFHRPISPQRFFLALLLSNLAVLVLNHSVLAEPLSSTDIAPGVVFHTYRLTMPNDVFVLQIERDRPEYEFRVGWPGNERNYAVRSSTTAIISAAEQAGMNVIGAVNASFFEFDNINVTGLTASSGQIVHPPSGSYETAIIGTDRQGTILEDVTNQVSTLTFASGNTITLNAFNQIHTAGQLTLYTDNWGKVEHTMGANAVAYVIDKLSAPPRAKREFVGRITAKVTGDNANNYPVPVGGAVLLGDAGINMLRTVAVGQELQFNIGASVNTLNNLDIALTGVGRIMHNGARDTVNWSQYNFGNVRHPRTVWAWNDDYWFLMVVDGRSERSVGMTFAEMADFLEEELSATDALNLDGGGSSTMVVDGAVRNAPSDGQQRPVANALLLIATTPTTTSLPFADNFAASERRGEWDDKFTFNAPTTETTPSGDDAALLVQDPSGGVETVRAGEWGDCNYAIQADVLCENRSDEAASGYERYALFARDTGTGALGLSSYGGGNCYALTYDSHTGQFMAGIYRDGVLTDFSGGGFAQLETAWRTLRIECFGERIRYLVDGKLLADITNDERPHGFFGVGYHEFFGDNNLIHGTRVDDVLVTTAFGDSNGDDEIAFYDFQAQSFCLNGPDDDFAAGFFCRNSDTDGDADVDVRDAAMLQQFFGLTAP